MSHAALHAARPARSALTDRVVTTRRWTIAVLALATLLLAGYLVLLVSTTWLLAATWSGAEEAFRASKSGRNLLQNAPDLEADLAFCARESALDVVPRLVGMRDGAAEIAA